MERPVTDISVLIATRNRPALLARCLAALCANSHLPREIVVIDQGEDAAAQAVMQDLAAPGVHLRYERVSPRGKSVAINHAVGVASGEFLALTDDDVAVDTSWFEKFLGVRRRHPDVGTFCGRVLPEANTSELDYLNLVLGTEPRWIDGRSNPLNTGFCGANVFIERRLFAEVGGYDARFGPGSAFRSSDDGELAYRLVRHGVRILYCPELLVYHSGWRRERDNRQLLIDYAFSLGAFAGHYLRRGDVRPCRSLGKKLLYKSGRLLLGLLRRRPEDCRDAWFHLAGCPRGFFKGFAAR